MRSVRFIERASGWIFLIVVFYLVLIFEDTSPRTPRLPPAVPEGEIGRELPVPDARDPGISILIENKVEAGLGTGFSVNSAGVWVTARHVVDNCQVVALVRDGEAPDFVSEITVHPSADIAILRVLPGTPPLLMSKDPLEYGESGFHFGYPQGLPRQVRSTLIGRRQMYTEGRYRVREPVLAWSENERIPEFKGELGGMSGGVVLDAGGAIVGVTVAESLRRGRIFTADPLSIFEALRLAQRNPADSSTLTISAEELVSSRLKATGKRLRDDGVVARVFCLTEVPPNW